MGASKKSQAQIAVSQGGIPNREYPVGGIIDIQYVYTSIYIYICDTYLIPIQTKGITIDVYLYTDCAMLYSKYVTLYPTYVILYPIYLLIGNTDLLESQL